MIYQEGTPVPASKEHIIECVRYALAKNDVRFGTGDTACLGVGDHQCIVFLVQSGIEGFDAKALSLFLRDAFTLYLDMVYGGGAQRTYQDLDSTALHDHLRKAMQQKPPSAN